MKTSSDRRLMFDDKTLFLGPKAENIEELKAEICRVLDRHAAWRTTFHPEDSALVRTVDREEDSYKRFFLEIRERVEEMTQKLQGGVPFFSPRYIGHMNADVLIPAVVAYFAAMLYNPNNVTSESSPVTTMLEIICGIQLAALVGYVDNTTALEAVEKIEKHLGRGDLSIFERVRSWGHLTSGGTAANIEAIWAARNLKYFPLTVRAVCYELGISLSIRSAGAAADIRDLKDWPLLNLAPEEVLGLRQRLLESVDSKQKENVDELLRSKSISSVGCAEFRNSEYAKGVLIVPSTRHYSIPKLADILGIGRDQVIAIPLDKGFRMDVDALEEKLSWCRDQNPPIPVIAVISVFGSTEEGAVDNHERILEVRTKFSNPKGGLPLRFYWHCDAAYGGYALSVFRTQPGGSASRESLLEIFETNLLASRTSWPDSQRYSLGKALSKWLQDVGRSARTLQETDSITIDPHKWGYIPYPCGAVVFKRKEVRNLISVDAPYVFHGGAREETKFIGRFILEGSKPGAAAAACWLAHKMLPLDQGGYGRLVAKTMYGAKELYWRLQHLPLNDFTLVPLSDPDLNIVCFAINRDGNSSLRVMNAINQLLYEALSPTRAFGQQEPAGTQSFFVSKTDLEFEAYGSFQTTSTVLDVFLERLGISREQFRAANGLEDRQGLADSRVTVNRCTIMGPWLLEEGQRGSGKTYLDLFLGSLEKVINSQAFLKDIELKRAVVGLESKLDRDKLAAVLFADDCPGETKSVIELLRAQLGKRVYICQKDVPLDANEALRLGVRIEVRQVESPLEAMDELRDSAIELAVQDVDFPRVRLAGVTGIYSYIRLERGGQREKSIPCLLYTHFDEWDEEFQEIKDLISKIGPSHHCLLSKKDWAPDVVAKNICALLAWRLEETDGGRLSPAKR